MRSVAILLAAITVGCSGGRGALTREGAADLIRRDEFFSQLRLYKFDIGPGGVWVCKDNMKPMEPWDALEAAGILTLKWTDGCSVERELTDKGRSLTALVKSSKLFSLEERAIKVADRELVEVTGVAASPDGRSAAVEFTWRWVANEVGDAFHARGKRQSRYPFDDRGEPVVPEGLAQSTAHCRLWDDGWRCSVEADGARRSP